MMQFVALFLGITIGSVALMLRSEAKQRSRVAPDKDGWREPEFLLFDHAGGQWWFGLGLLVYGALLATMVISTVI